MRPYESYQHELGYKFYNRHQSKIISFNVENIVLITNGINGIECLLNVSEIFPLGFLYPCGPILKHGFSRGIALII